MKRPIFLETCTHKCSVIFKSSMIKTFYDFNGNMDTYLIFQNMLK